MWSNHRPQWRRPQVHKPHHHLLNLEHKRMAPLRDHRRLVRLDLRLRSCSHHCLLSPEIRPRQRWHHPCHHCRHSSWICRQHHSLYLLNLRRLHRLLPTSSWVTRIAAACSSRSLYRRTYVRGVITFCAHRESLLAGR